MTPAAEGRGGGGDVSAVEFRWVHPDTGQLIDHLVVTAPNGAEAWLAVQLDAVQSPPQPPASDLGPHLGPWRLERRRGGGDWEVVGSSDPGGNATLMIEWQE